MDHTTVRGNPFTTIDHVSGLGLFNQRVRPPCSFYVQVFHCSTMLYNFIAIQYIANTSARRRARATGVKET